MKNYNVMQFSYINRNNIKKLPVISENMIYIQLNENIVNKKINYYCTLKLFSFKSFQFISHVILYIP